MAWYCEKCGHGVDENPLGRVCGQDRLIPIGTPLPRNPVQEAMGLPLRYRVTEFISVPCAGEFRDKYDTKNTGHRGGRA